MLDFKKFFYILYCFSLLLILFLIHVIFRILNTKETITINYLQQNITNNQLIIILIIFIFHIFIILNILYTKVYKNKKQSKIILKYIEIFKKIVHVIYWRPLEDIHNYIAPDLPYSGVIIVWIVQQAEKAKWKTYIYRNSYIIFSFSPRIIISFIFFTEIFFANQLKYFFYAIILFILPIIYEIYLKLAYSFCERNMREIQEALIVIPIGSPNKYGVFTNFEFRWNLNYEFDDEVFKEDIYYWTLMFRLKNYIRFLKDQKELYLPYINMICSLFYIMGGSYRIYNLKENYYYLYLLLKNIFFKGKD